MSARESLIEYVQLALDILASSPTRPKPQNRRTTRAHFFDDGVDFYSSEYNDYSPAIQALRAAPRWNESELPIAIARLLLDEHLIVLVDENGVPVESGAITLCPPAVHVELERFLYSYLAGSGNIATLDSSAFDDEWNAATKRWSSPTIARSLTPLLNFSTDLDNVVLPNGFRITRFTNEEKESLYLPEMPNEAFTAWEIVHARHKLLLSSDEMPASGPDFSSGEVQASRVITALRLLGPGLVGTQGAYRSYDNVSGNVLPVSFRTFTDVSLPRWPSYDAPYKLTTDQILPLKLLIEDLSKPIVASELGLALRRFNQMYTRNDPADRIIDLAIVLETTLLHGIEQELGYRLAMRGAYLMREHRPPADTFAKLKRLYKLRSSVVHNGMHANSSDADMFEGMTREVLRRLVTLTASGRKLGVVVNEIDKAIPEGMAR